MSAKNKRQAMERYAASNADVITEDDKRMIRDVVEFVLYCRHGSPRSSSVSGIVPTAERLRERFRLKMVHYDREHPEGANES